VAAYVSSHDVFLVGAAGQRRLIWSAGGSEYDEPEHLTWSPSGGLLAWSSTEGELYIYPMASSRTESLPCACGGLAFAGESVTTIENDASATLSFAPHAQAPARNAVSSLAGVEYPEALATIQGNLLVAAAIEGKTGVSGGPSHFYLISPGGGVRKLGADRSNSEVSSAYVAPNGYEVAYVSVSASGVCYDFASVAILDARTGQITYPRMPSTQRAWNVLWLHWTNSGALQALFAHSPECAANGGPASGHHPAELGVWTLQRGRWTQLSRDGRVTETESKTTAMLTPTPSSASEYPYSGTLSVGPGPASQRRVASRVADLVLRPDDG
jgi:hypothetical protein